MDFVLPNGLLFIHTPKTAGTSLRSALLRSYGQKRCWYDYGIEAPETTPEVKEALCSSEDMYSVAELFAHHVGTRTFCLSGHFTASRYTPFFKSQNTIMFFRDPVQRYLSQYEHHCRLDGYQGSLEDFCQLPRYDNVQFKTLGHYPLHLLGFIGLQEYYQQSLTSIQTTYSLDLEELMTNINEKQNRLPYQCDKTVLEKIKLNNQQDLILYEKVLLLFRQRQRLEQAGFYYVHGCVQRRTTTSISGFASQYCSKEAVVVDIYINDNLAGSVRAKEDRPWLRGFNPGRYGYIGFNFNFDFPLQSEDEVICKVTNSGQLLYEAF